MRILLKSEGRLSPSPMPFAIRASGTYQGHQYQVIVCDDSMADWIAVNAILSELTDAEAMTWIIRMQNPFTKLVAAVQRHLDSTAQQRNYDGILSACSYATSTNTKFAAEGQACVEWRDDVWAACYAVQDDVLAGNRGIPTESELISELPEFVWPEV